MIKNLKFIVSLILLGISSLAFANTDKSNGKAVATLSANRVALGEEVTLTVTVSDIKNGENKYKITIPSEVTVKSGQAVGTTEYGTSSNETKTIGVYTSYCPKTATFGISDSQSQTAPSFSGDNFVVFEDVTAPVINMASEFNQITDINMDNYTVVGSEFDPTSVTDNASSCQGSSITIRNDVNGSSSLEGVVFAIGNHEVVWTAVDASGNLASKTINITITKGCEITIDEIASDVIVSLGDNLNSINQPSYTASNYCDIAETGWMLNNTKVSVDYTFSCSDDGKELKYYVEMANGMLFASDPKVVSVRMSSIALLDEVGPFCEGSSPVVIAPEILNAGSSVDTAYWLIVDSEDATIGTRVDDLSTYNFTTDGENGKYLRYYVTRNYGCEALISNSVILNIPKAPVVGEIATPNAICEGSKLEVELPTYNTFGVEALLTEWTLNDAPFDIINNTLGEFDNGATLKYSVKNVCGTAQSNAVTVTVKSVVELEEDLIETIRVCEGETLSALMVYYEGDDLTTGWEIEGNQLAVDAPMEASYSGKKIRFFATNGVCSVYSSEVDLFVDSNLTQTSVTGAGTYYEDANEIAEISIQLAGTNSENATYTWYKKNKDGEDELLSETTNILAFNPVKVSDTGIYYAKVFVDDNVCLSEAVQLSDIELMVTNRKPEVSISLTSVCEGNTILSGIERYIDFKTDAGDVKVLNSGFEELIDGEWISVDDFATHTAVAADNGRVIRLWATNSFGTSYSNAIELVVGTIPTIDLIDGVMVCNTNNIEIPKPSLVSTSEIISEGWEWLTGESWESFDPTKFSLEEITNLKVRYSATNACGTAHSNEASVSVDSPMSIANIEAVAATCVGEKLNLSNPEITINATEPSAQGWQVKGLNGTRWKEYDVNTLVEASQNGATIRYYATNNVCGTVYSNEMPIIVNDLVSISDIATSQNVCLGALLSLENPDLVNNGSEVVAQGWQIKILPNDAWLDFNNTEALSYNEDGYEVRYFAENACGIAYSNSMVVNVEFVPSTIDLVLNKTAYFVGDVLEVESEDNEKWYLNDVEFDVNTPLTIEQNGALLKKAIEKCIVVESDVIAITVLEKPVVAALETPEKLCANTILEISEPMVENGASVTEAYWMLDGEKVDLTNELTEADNGKSLKYVVETAAGNVESNAVLISVYESMQFVSALTDVVVCEGGTLDLNADVKNAVSYAWYKDDSQEAIATESKLNIDNVATEMTLKVVAGDICGNSIESDEIAVSINKSVEIVSQPSSQKVCAGTEVELTFDVASADELAYAWYKMGQSGVYSSEKDLKVVATDEEAFYYAKVTYKNGGECMEKPLVSEMVSVVAKAPITVSIDNVNYEKCEGESIEIVPSVTGENVAYQWYKDSELISTDDKLVLNNVEKSDSGVYQLQITRGDEDACDVANSEEITVVVKKSMSILTQPESVTLCDNSDLELTVEAVGEGSLSYEWYKEGVDEVVSSSDKFAMTVDVESAGIYYAVVKTDDATCGTSEMTTDTIEVVVNEIPEFSVKNIENKRGEVNLMSAVQAQNGTYVWFYEDEAKTQPLYTMVGDYGTEEGSTYYVEVEKDGCSSMKDFVVVKTIEIVDIEETSAVEISMYPNPAVDVFTISANGAILNKISVYDMSSRLVKLIQVNAELVTMNANEFESGIYFVNIEVDGNVVRKKLIVK